MNYSEEAIRFSCSEDTLLGILARPEVPALSGFIVVVGGPQYRVGSHRQFVLLSRRLAAAGHAVLRFDYRGMGDSTGQLRPFDSVSDDIAAAINALQLQVPSIQYITLWGLCDGASAALIYCQQTADSRVRNLCLLNPWVRSELSLARTQVKHYYRQRLGQMDFWAKLLRGGVAWQALKELARNVGIALGGMRPQAPEVAASQPVQTFQHRMATGWNFFSGNIVVILSGDDYTAKEFSGCLSDDPAWQNALAHPGLIRHDLPGVDHTFSTATARARVEELTLNLGQNPRQPAASRLDDLVRTDVQFGATTQSQVRAPV